MEVSLGRVQRVFGRPAVVVADTTIEYRRLARSQVTPADCVVEVGASFGDCTAVLASRARETFASEAGIETTPYAGLASPH